MINIKISGNATEGDPDSYSLSLLGENNSWSAAEPNGEKNIFKTKAGSWLFKPAPVKGVYLNDSKGTVVLLLRNLDPSSSKVGQTGGGQAYETARVIDWRVDSI